MAEIGFYYNILYFSQICTIFLSELSMQQWDFDKIFQNRKNLANNEEN